MSMTKRYLDSLPADEQDAILGGIDNAYISPDEWTEDAENEPTDEELAEWARALMEEDEPIYELKPGLKRCEYVLRSGNQCELADGHIGRHAYETGDDDGFIEQEDEELNDPLVKCRICRKTWPISEMNTNGECPDCQLEEWERRENAPLVKPQPKGVKEGCFDI